MCHISFHVCVRSCLFVVCEMSVPVAVVELGVPFHLSLGAPFSTKYTSLGTNLPPTSFSEMAPRTSMWVVVGSNPAQIECVSTIVRS